MTADVNRAINDDVARLDGIKSAHLTFSLFGFKSML